MTDKKKSATEGLPCGVTEARIKQWKNKWGDVFLISVPLDDDGTEAHGFFKKPSMDTLSAAAKFEDDDPIKAGLIIFEGCKLQVDPELDNEPDTKISAIRQLGSLVKIRQGSIKKL